MAKMSQIEKAIASIDAQIEVLNLARQHLVAQQQYKKPKPAPKKAPKPEAVA